MPKHTKDETYFDDDGVERIAPAYSLALESNGYSILIKRGVCARCHAKVPVEKAFEHSCKPTEGLLA
jgi:hypothetical protein